MSGAEGHNCKESDFNQSALEKLPECPVCLQTCLQPISLPCSHIFCFLCAKGIASHNKKCALCRKRIPDGYLNSPSVVDDPTPPVAIDGKYQWFYQGTEGWWQYDPRISSEIETSYKESQKSLKIMIAGFMYVVDLDKMIQYRENIPSRVRGIKRDLIDIPDRKGVAGLPLRKLLSAKESETNKSKETENVTASAALGPINRSTDDEISASLSLLSLTHHVPAEEAESAIDADAKK